jgi:hypothetical protein
MTKAANLCTISFMAHKINQLGINGSSSSSRGGNGGSNSGGDSGSTSNYSSRSGLSKELVTAYLASELQRTTQFT